MIALIPFFSPVVKAGKLDLLLMPGELIEGHAKFEEKCKSCHETLKKASQAGRCLSCHDHADIEADIDHSEGFHGRLEKDLARDCKHCHTDHKGRDRDIVNLDTESFDHKQTDFELKGAHRTLSCVLCHTKALKKYRNAPSVCYDCHKKDDVHKGKLGEECDKCHNEKNWREQAFDHDKDTEYKLIGKHKDIDCKLCHADEHYKNTPKDCYSCHLINDVHNGRYQNKCEKCHSSNEWKKLTFDHGKDTKFPLEGRHKEVKCDTCHIKGPYDKKLKTSCFSCHEKDDEHKGRNGEKCKDCHNVQSWKKVDFDHERDTKFPLKGQHKDLVCSACHRTAAMDALKDATCIDCHRGDDVHKGEQGENCAYCHNEKGWTERVFFEHDLTRFPLIGIHSVTACESCHLNAEFKKADIECLSCHKADDVHEGRFGKKCGECHNPNNWMLWAFDHDKQTDYPLDGKHRDLACEACHRVPLDEDNKMSKQCFGCHRGDDVHRGGFGRHCDRCHSTDTFKEPVFH
jgi:Zn finger protein HypA/HybF involved in hydrogenase expression